MDRSRDLVLKINESPRLLEQDFLIFHYACGEGREVMLPHHAPHLLIHKRGDVGMLCRALDIQIVTLYWNKKQEENNRPEVPPKSKHIA
jgi:hypothetical protein